MRPNLVLDEDEKKRRFSNYKPKEEVVDVSESEEGEIEIVLDTTIKRKRKQKSDRNKKRKSDAINGSDCEIHILKTASSLLPWPHDDSDDSIEDWSPLLPEEIDEDSNDPENNFFLDPYTGEVKTESVFQDNLENTKSSGVEEAPSSFEPGRIIQYACSLQSPGLSRRREEEEARSDLRILSYIHKKFGNINKTGPSKYLDHKHSVHKIRIFSSEPGQQLLQSSLSSQPVRYADHRQSIS